MSDLCRAPYRRPNGELLACHYLARHPTLHHSWWTVQVDDQPHIVDLVDDIERGLFDAYLESILAAAHTRKRALRGVRV